MRKYRQFNRKITTFGQNWEIMLKISQIKECAAEAGFDLAGVTYPREFELNRSYFAEWIEAGGADSLSYMKQYMDVRFNPANLLDGCKSVVVCALNYKNEYSIFQQSSTLPKIASYALATDYHKVIRRQLKALLRALQQIDPTLSGRCCVDTAPLLEKQLAHEAGLGWIGRQSLLITPQFGSFIVLGILLLDRHVDTFDKPYEGIGCGSCHRCVEKCPSRAILPNRMIDSRRCISALTVECDNPTSEDLHGWLFGCDECQSCCPHNHSTTLAHNAAIQPIFAPIEAREWQKMSQEEFTQKLSATPMKRGGLERIVKNCKIGD